MAVILSLSALTERLDTWGTAGNRRRSNARDACIVKNPETKPDTLNEIRMMTSLNGNIFRVTGPLRGESTGHRWIPLTEASDAELWCFIWLAPEQMAEQTVKILVIRDTMELITTVFVMVPILGLYSVI